MTTSTPAHKNLLRQAAAGCLSFSLLLLGFFFLLLFFSLLLSSGPRLTAGSPPSLLSGRTANGPNTRGRNEGRGHKES